MIKRAEIVLIERGLIVKLIMIVLISISCTFSKDIVIMFGDWHNYLGLDENAPICKYSDFFIDKASLSKTTISNMYKNGWSLINIHKLYQENQNIQFLFFFEK